MRVVVAVRSVAVSVGCSIGMAVAVLVVVEGLFVRCKVLNGSSREVTGLKLELKRDGKQLKSIVRSANLLARIRCCGWTKDGRKGNQA